MKLDIKNLVAIGIIFLLAQPVIAQPSITLEAFGGWLWTGQAGYNGSIKVNDGGNCGARLGVSPMPQTVVEFEWNHTDTNIQWLPTEFIKTVIGN